MTEDEEAFGARKYVYCKSHLRPHTTGWCTVAAEDKVDLDTTDRDLAYKKARELGFKIYGEDA
jgi:hypothetical protein